MPLPPGTALQNGHYIIDALLAAAPNGDVYWGTHVLSGMQVYIQVVPLAQTTDPTALSALMARLEGLSFSPKAPWPKPFQLFPGEGHTLCLAMGMTIGLPWSEAYKIQGGMSPKRALKTIRTVASGIIWLAEQELTDLDLAFNRVWISPMGDRIFLSGLTPASETGEPFSEQPGISALARLLASFLLGDLPPTTASDLIATLRQRRPHLSPLILQAIHQGITASATPSPATAIQQWLARLPDADSIRPVNRATTAGSVPPSRPRQVKARQGRLYPALGGTALVAAIAGVGLGTIWRLNAARLPGSIQFDPSQSFPSKADWSGDTPAAFDTPYAPNQSAPTAEDWLDSDWGGTVQPDAEWSPEAADLLEDDWKEESAPWPSDEQADSLPPSSEEFSEPETPLNAPAEDLPPETEADPPVIAPETSAPPAPPEKVFSNAPERKPDAEATPPSSSAAESTSDS